MTLTQILTVLNPNPNPIILTLTLTLNPNPVGGVVAGTCVGATTSFIAAVSAKKCKRKLSNVYLRFERKVRTTVRHSFSKKEIAGNHNSTSKNMVVLLEDYAV